MAVCSSRAAPLLSAGRPAVIEPGSLLIAAAVLLLVAAYLARPFFDARKYRRHEPDPEISALLAERDRVLDLISELDSDFEMGKVDAEEYRPRRANLIKRGADLLRRIDELRAEGDSGRAEPPSSERDRALEAEISRRRRAEGRPERSRECPNCGAHLEPQTSSCGQCGEPVRTDAGA